VAARALRMLAEEASRSTSAATAAAAAAAGTPAAAGAVAGAPLPSLHEALQRELALEAQHRLGRCAGKFEPDWLPRRREC
jgi:hypothetical protein